MLIIIFIVIIIMLSNEKSTSENGTIHFLVTLDIYFEKVVNSRLNE
jgi:hypothetical protein